MKKRLAVVLLTAVIAAAGKRRLRTATLLRQ